MRRPPSRRAPRASTGRASRAASFARPPAADPDRRDDRCLVRWGEPAVVLVDEPLPLEPEVVGIRAEEAARVGRPRQRVEAVVLERGQVFPADFGVALDLRQLEPSTHARLAKTASDLEHLRPLLTVDASLARAEAARHP